MRRTEILKNTGPVTVTKKWYVNGDQSDVGAVTYEVFNPDGSTLDSGAANKTGSGSTTAYNFTLAKADTEQVTELLVEWTRTDTGASLTDEIGIVGSRLFTEAEARAFKISGGLAPLSDTSAYEDDDLADARGRITEQFERRTHVSMIRRYARARFVGNDSRALQLIDAEQTHGGPGFYRRPLTLLAGSINGTALTASEISKIEVDRSRHKFYRYDGNRWNSAVGEQPRRNIILEYEYGLPVVPYEATRAGLLLLLKSIVPSDVSSRATSYSNEDGTFRLSIPSLNYPTGNPEIDEFINAFDERPLFA